MFAIALGLAASLSWGVADFFGGIQSRRMPGVAVGLGSQLAGLGLVGARGGGGPRRRLAGLRRVAAVVAARGEPIPDGGEFLLYAALSSLAGIVGPPSF